MMRIAMEIENPGDIHSTAKTIDGHTGPVNAVGLSGDGKRLVSGSEDGTIRMMSRPWTADAVVCKKADDVRDGKNTDVAMAAYPHPLTGGCDGDELVVCGGGHLGSKVLVHKFSGKLLHTLVGHTTHVECVGLNSDGTLLVTGAADGLRTWNAVKGESLSHLKTDKEVVALAVAVRTIASAAEGTLTIWQQVGDESAGVFETFTTIVINPVLGVHGVALNWDGSKVAYCQGFTVEVRERARGEFQDDPLVLKGHAGLVNAVAFGPAGMLVSGANDYVMCVWDLDKKGTDAAREHLIHRLEGHTAGVLGVAISSDGTCYASASHDGCVRWYGRPRP